MGLWLFAKNLMGSARLGAALFAFAGLALSSGQGYAGPLEQELASLGETQGRPPEEMKRLADHVQRAQSLGLPTDALVDKIKEGMAKGIETPRIEQRLDLMINHMKLADTLLKEAGGAGKSQAVPAGRDRAISVLSEALGRGVTPDEVRDVHRSAGAGQREVKPDALAYGAKGMALMKEGGLLPDQSKSLAGAALRQGVESTNLLDLARELKGRGRELRDNPVRLKEIQGAVERGQRVEKIIGELRSRPDTIRPQQLDPGKKEPLRPATPGVQSPERTQPSDRLSPPDRPSGSDRPQQPDRPQSLDRPQAPDSPQVAERPPVPERVERPTLPDRPQRLEKPVIPVRPDRPDLPRTPNNPNRR